MLSGGRHSVGSPDVSLPGWLPATHPSFQGKAPTGAAFGYNLAAHPELMRIFPPIPPSAAVVFIDRGEDTRGATLAPMGYGGLCAVDAAGIWWMSDCEGDAPWPTGWTVPVVGQTGNAPSGPECPRTVNFKLILFHVVMVFTTERTVVTSLRPAVGAPLQVLNRDGVPAATGDLNLDLNLNLLTSPAAVTGSTVFKRLDGQTFSLGPVVEALRAGNGCTLTPTIASPQADGSSWAQGVVTLDVDTNAGERELPVDVVRLDQAQERYHRDVPYIGFDSGRASGVRMRFHVPTAGLPAGPIVALRMQLLGRAAGSLPALIASYRILPRPQTARALPDETTEMTLTLPSGQTVSSDQYIEVHSAAIAILAGDTVLVTLSRAASDGYVGEVGMMRPVLVLSGS